MRIHFFQSINQVLKQYLQSTNHMRIDLMQSTYHMTMHFFPFSKMSWSSSISIGRVVPSLRASPAPNSAQTDSIPPHTFPFCSCWSELVKSKMLADASSLRSSTDAIASLGLFPISNFFLSFYFFPLPLPPWLSFFNLSMMKIIFFLCVCRNLCSRLLVQLGKKDEASGRIAMIWFPFFKMI